MITGINIVRNCINTGYPFIESILSALPFCDEYLVNDGGSDDGTLEALTKLSAVYPRVRVLEIPDTENIRWDSVSKQINQMIQQAQGTTLFLGNADELIHENDVRPIQYHIKHMTGRVLRFDRQEVRHNWSGFGQDVYHPARIAKNCDGVRQDWNGYGGDEFIYEDGWDDPDRELRIHLPIYHLYNMFPENRVAKLRNDAEYLAPGDKVRVKTYETMKNSTPQYSTPTQIWGELPALARGLQYMSKYKIRECLYDSDWVKTVTGLTL